MNILNLSIVLALSSTVPCLAGVKDNIRAEAIRQGVPADLAIAVATVESGLNPRVVGSKGELGVFQIMPYHATYAILSETDSNIHEGVKLIKASLRACRDMSMYSIICYNQGTHRRPKYPQLHPYYLKIKKAMRDV